nr:uncharacterized protein LOC131794604 [Pocillopora verrucosa]
MAAEHETPVSLYFKMSAAILWRNELKIEYEEDYEETKNRLFTILGWLGRANLGNSLVASCDLASYLKLSVSKYVLNYGPSIFIKLNRFPYREDTVNEWFNLPPEDDWPERGEAVKVINVDKCGLERKCYRTQNQVENAFPDSLEDDEFEVFFHGTSQKHAKDIIEDGIDLKKGEIGKDFSNGDGFYLSKNFDEALRWARQRHGHGPTVLVFRLKKTELRGDENENGYDLRNPSEKKDWQEVVEQFRSEKPERKFCKKIKRYQFIEGPMASRSRKKPKSSTPDQKVDSYQLCVREEICAELFDRSLHSVVFLDK